MKYTKPIVTTWTAGLHPDYRRYLFAEGTDSPEGFAGQMQFAGRMSYDERQLLSRDMLKYLVDCKLWSRQDKCFVDFVKRISRR